MQGLWKLTLWLPVYLVHFAKSTLFLSYIRRFDLGYGDVPLFEDKCRIMAPFWRCVAKRWLFIADCSLPCGVVSMVFIIFMELWVTIFASNMGGFVSPGFTSTCHVLIQN